MNLVTFVLYFGLISTSIKPEYENIVFSENIEYCTNIIHNPEMTQEFLETCDLKQTNKYIMMVKRNFN
jgi:hypothetical protein